MADDEHRHCRDSMLEAQTELLTYRDTDGNLLRGGQGEIARTWSVAGSSQDLGRLELHVEATRDARAVDHRPIQMLRQHARQCRHDHGVGEPTARWLLHAARRSVALGRWLRFSSH